MIDLGNELASFTDDEPPRSRRGQQPTPQPHPDGGSTVALNDLQAAGFNYGGGSAPRKIYRQGSGYEPLTITAKTWLPGNDFEPNTPWGPVQPTSAGPWTIVTGDDKPTIHYVAVDDEGPVDDSDQLMTFGCPEPILTIYPKEHDE